MINYYALDDNHQPVLIADVLTWARLFETANSIVAVTEFACGSRSESVKQGRVSTVFLGLDYGWNRFDNRGPILFETMVFGGSLDGEQERYSTWAEAEAGHVAMVERVMAAK